MRLIFVIFLSILIELNSVFGLNDRCIERFESTAQIYCKTIYGEEWKATPNALDFLKQNCCSRSKVCFKDDIKKYCEMK